MEVTFRAAVCATMVFVPKVLIAVCSASEPRLTKETIKPMDTPVARSRR